MPFFGLKLGLDLEMREAHPHQKFQGVPPFPRDIFVQKFTSIAEELLGTYSYNLARKTFLELVQYE